MIWEAITSSPLNVFVTFALGIGIVYLLYNKPSSSSSSSSNSSSNYTSSRAFLRNNTRTGGFGLAHAGTGTQSESEELQRAIAQIERQERDMIRQEQDEAYQQSLKADREKKLKREQELREKEERERIETERQSKLQQLHDRLTELRANISKHLPQESTDDGQKVDLVFKLPDGSRVKRSFSKQDKVKYMYWYIFSLSNAPLQFKMTTNFPKRELPGRPPVPEDFGDAKTTDPTCEPNCDLTLEEAGLTETQILFIYDLEA